MNTKKIVSIVISAYNEEANVVPLYQALTSQFLVLAESVTYELVFVNDGSKDTTLAKLQQLKDTDAHVKIVDLHRNFGHEIAMTAGMYFAAGDAVLFMDADLQHPPEIVPKMITAWLNGSKIVITKRIDNVDNGFFRKLINKVFYVLLNKLSEYPIEHNAPDFRLLDRVYLDVIKNMKERSRVFRGLVGWLGQSNVETIEFVAAKRQAGESKYSLKMLFNLAYDSIVSFSLKPLRLALYLGLIVALLAVGVGGYHIVEHIIFREPNSGFATLLTAICALGAVQLLVLGVMGEYIAKIHLEVKQRPLFIAEYISQDKHVEAAVDR